ncbi:MAG: hypothetical protein IPJ28_09240 [Betaproteobacteria bacterium]|nr:hypothetical protein [Betaproteobacteria bacterium]
MNFPADTLIALAFLVPVAAFAVAELLAVRKRDLDKPSRMNAAADPEPMIVVDVRAAAANDADMRDAA